MMSALFESVARVHALRAGPGGALLEGFAGALSGAGYAQITARRHLRAAEHFVDWAARHKLWPTDVTAQVVDRFTCHVSRCRCAGYGHSDRSLIHSVRLFVRHLEESGTIRVATAPSPRADPPFLAAFRAWMHQQRGTCDGTLDNYGIHIRELLGRVGGEPGKLDARTLRQFVLEGSHTCGWAAAKKRTTALRMFLRFLIAGGHCASSLDGAIPVLAHWRLASLPRYLPAEDVERLIASCDLRSPVGTRDRAILLLLARLGFRAGDIVQLRLTDLDWKGAWIRVCGKGRRQSRLPMTQEVGKALVVYLKTSRPATSTDCVFVRSRAPFLGFRSHCAVSVIVDRAFCRAGVTRPSRGAAHLLRHSVATSMLRHGASLQDVAALLRHRSIATTQIYAKVDVAALGTIAQPWPTVPSC
jgi:integrase/recombinase XerD